MSRATMRARLDRLTAREPVSIRVIVRMSDGGEIRLVPPSSRRSVTVTISEDDARL